MTTCVFESCIGLSISIMQYTGKIQRLVKGGEKAGKGKRKMNGSMQEGNRVLGKRGRGKGNIVDKEEMQIKWRLENRILNSAKRENKETERKGEQANVKRENAI